MKTLLTLLFLTAVAAAEERKDYTNYKLIKIFPKSESEGLMIADWEINDDDFDVWNSVKKEAIVFDVLLSPSAFQKYSFILNTLDIPFQVAHENIQQVVDQEARELSKSRMEGKVVGTYPKLAAILSWMDGIENANRGFVSQYSAGKSEEERDIRVMVLKVGSPSKRVWLDCGIHPREYISPATCISLIDKFVNDYNKQIPEIVDLLTKYEIHIVPMLNPDGYEYTFFIDRYWRKNRRYNFLSSCYGADVNRNFPFKWFTGGSSSNPCHDTFAGPSAGSELEAQALMNSINKYDNWAAFLSLHSFGNWFLISYGHTTALPSDYSVQKAAGDVYATAVRNVYGEIFTVGSIANLLYVASGGSSDWAYGTKGIVHSYAIELRPKSDGSLSLLGFTINESQIGPVGNETYAGIKALLNFI